MTETSCRFTWHSNSLAKCAAIQQLGRKALSVRLLTRLPSLSTVDRCTIQLFLPGGNGKFDFDIADRQLRKADLQHYEFGEKLSALCKPSYRCSLQYCADCGQRGESRNYSRMCRRRCSIQQSNCLPINKMSRQRFVVILHASSCPPQIRPALLIVAQALPRSARGIGGAERQRRPSKTAQLAVGVRSTSTALNPPQ